MGKGIFIVGTDTDIGKTFVTSGITYKLKEQGLNAIPFKGIQSGGVIDENGKITPPDVNYLRSVCDEKCNFTEQEFEDMNVYCLKEEVSPHLAARMENVIIDKTKVINQYKKLLDKYDYVIAEGAGGIIVPLIDDKYYIYDLIKDLDVDVVIVAKAGVGTINHTVLTNEFLKGKGINVRGIIINNYNNEFYEDDNIELIEKLTGLEIICKLNTVESHSKKDITDEYKNIDIDKLLKLFK